jgi:hypothetical protein
MCDSCQIVRFFFILKQRTLLYSTPHSGVLEYLVLEYKYLVAPRGCLVRRVLAKCLNRHALLALRKLNHRSNQSL